MDVYIWSACSSVCEDSCPCCFPPYILRQGNPRAYCEPSPRTHMSLTLYLLPHPPCWATGVYRLTWPFHMCWGSKPRSSCLWQALYPLSHLLDRICVSSSQCPSASPSVDSLQSSFPVASRISFLAAFLFESGHNPGSCFAFSLFASINPR